ncbi:hypothetical protein [Tissierella praeacuta]|uniref:hypothetical protein n=1 Tax=Tissierella praeacuta TaxID=43131 RepID=UPI003340B703
MKKEDLYNSFDSIRPNDYQKSRMLNGILNPNRKLVSTKPRRTKIVIAAAAISLMTTTVIAANIPAFQNLLEKINPNIVEFIEPVEKISIDQGIKMEVVAVGRYDNMVKAYITFQDLEGNRIKEDLSFLDYYNLEGANSCGWSLIDYDEENKKATILVEAENSTKFEGENLTFKIENIFYDHKEFKDYKIGIDLNKMMQNPSYVDATTEQFLSWSSGRLYGGLASDDEIIPILEPHAIDFKFPDIKTSMISNIGVIDGKLHVQLWRDKSFEGQGVNIYLKNSKGEKINSDTDINFGIDKSKKPTNNTDYPSYKEYIFDINTDNLSGYELLGNFNSSQQLEGNWQVSFKAEENKILEKSDSLDLGDVKIENISINPFAIYFRGEGINGFDLSELDIKIKAENNVISDTKSDIIFSSCRWEGEELSNFILSYEIENPIDLNLIESITVNGIDILLK